MSDRSDTPVGAAPTKPAYYCMACPLTFANAETPNAHHDATGHNQHWKESRAFQAAPPQPLETAPAPHVPNPSVPTGQRNCVCGHARGDHDFDDSRDEWYGCAKYAICDCERFTPNVAPALPPGPTDAPFTDQHSEDIGKACEALWNEHRHHTPRPADDWRVLVANKALEANNAALACVTAYHIARAEVSALAAQLQAVTTERDQLATQLQAANMRMTLGPGNTR